MFTQHNVLSDLTERSEKHYNAFLMSKNRPKDGASLSPEEILKTLHELQVHQIELEMQNEALRTAQAKIGWMLSKKPTPIETGQTERHDQDYGDLTELNRDGIILKSIGSERLGNFASDYLELMGTSSAIYEANGDYAFGIFASGWCRMMDCASHRLCDTSDNAEALNSGRWLCHESCWTNCCKRVIAEGAPVDIACNGGIRMYAVPILARGNVVGAINFGYGDPPKDPEKLRKLAEDYHLDYDDLVREANAYDSRPPFMIALAKRRLHSTARLIGTMIETQQAKDDLRQDREHMDHILSVTRTNMNTLDSEYNLRQVDDVWRKIYGNPNGRKCYDYFMGFDKPCAKCGVPQALATKQTTVTEEFLPKENRHIEVHTIPFQDKNGEWLVTEFNIDITEHKRAEAEKEKLQSQLLQAQKMESVGKLAGGVAHDFNNMLGVILGHAEMALDQIDPGQPIFDNLQEVRKAAERSANLTRQLLTFARKQTIAPRIIDLNETVEGMLKMLRRLIGEDIDLAWLPGKNLAPIKVDPSQIDQILANLCVNARDAIDLPAPSGKPQRKVGEVGKITIETEAVTFDRVYCAVHADFLPGEYVLLEVSDNGCGMDTEILNHLFEPFFTTKEQGKGTGLGLSSVYGAVKQNNGFIKLYSEPGLGTTFKIYLPRHKAKTPIKTDKAKTKPAACGNETILLVEDEPSILLMVTRLLESMGYVVIAAKTPGEAIRLAYEHSGSIDLLMTDVVMPEMNGRDLAKNLLSIYPDIKRLFMSGYTASVIAHHGVLDEGVYFIQKPFSSKDLGAKLREVLDHKNAD